MNRSLLAIVALAVASVLAGAWYYRHISSAPTQRTLEVPDRAVSPQVSEEPVIRYPVPQLPAPAPNPEVVQEIEQQVQQSLDHPVDAAEDGKPPAEAALPELDDSDEAMHEALGEITEPGALESLFNPDNIIRRFVVTIDNIPGRKLPQRHILSKPAQGPFLAAGEEGAEYIDPDNYQRYAPYVRLLESLDTQKIAYLYIRFYPLFQAAFMDLGYPSGYFNDRLVEVIDHLLATPEIQGRVKLERPHVLYRFANPDLEALSAGQKVLLRIGYDNAVRVKAKLRELREALTAKAPAP
ncbi:MAG: DUF3014 domain-containing protein [Thiogranum sp.]|nr:DUF3014 domain-containing protein [Thiogranum sp.]